MYSCLSIYYIYGRICCAWAPRHTSAQRVYWCDVRKWTCARCGVVGHKWSTCCYLAYLNYIHYATQNTHAAMGGAEQAWLVFGALYMSYCQCAYRCILHLRVNTSWYLKLTRTERHLQTIGYGTTEGTHVNLTAWYL